MKFRHEARSVRLRGSLRSGLVLVLGALADTYALSPALCTPGSCDDNNVCTTDVCDPNQGCIFTPINCDDGNACTADSCSPTGGLGPATIFIGHDITQLERQYQKIGTFVQTWGGIGQATGAAVDNGLIYICNPAQGNNVIERRGPGNSNLGTITATVNGQWIEDLGNYTAGFILAGTYEGDVFRIDTTTGAHTLLFATGQLFVGVSYDGTNIWTTGGYANNLVHRRNIAGTVLSSFNTGRMNAAIGYDPDDGTLWIGHAGGQVTHYTTTGTLLGGFSTGTNGELVDGLELIRMPLTAGCWNTALTCNDNDFCTDDVCDPMSGCANPPHVCNDGNPCTDDACSQQLGCVTTNNTAPCEEYNLCTTGDVCSGGTCVTGTPIVCNDNNPCTSDGCDPRFGCDFININGYCNDGDLCTIEDVCVNGTCQPGIPVVCNDNNACTADSCNPAQGCVYTSQPDGATCDDGNACTNGDVCINGTCQGAPVVCVAPDPCHTAGPCDPLTGACTYLPAPNGTTCNDGNPCTAGDVCVNGTCAGTPIGVPVESQNLTAAADKITYFWSAASDATSYDAVRGDTAALPVGSSSVGEACFHDLATAKLIDETTPLDGKALWYLARPRNPCGPGPWGVQSNGTARVTGSCP